MSERAQIGLQLVIVLGVLAAAVYGIVASATERPPAITTTSAGPDASLIASTLRSPSPTPTATRPPTPSSTFVTLPPTPSPTPTPRPPTTTRYAYGGRSYTGVDLGTGWTVVAPFDARVEVHVYQLVDGEIREFTDVPGTPSYPYVVLVAPDRRLTLRAGALGTDTDLLVRASQITAGAPLFKVIGQGPSSWHEFYDDSIPFQIVVSLVNGAGADLDAASSVTVR